MLDYDALRQAAREAGFEEVGMLRADSICLHPEVRDMCASGKCGQYGRNWSCPPHTGTLEACRAKIAAFRSGILVQTVQPIEDCFDGEGMMEAERLHKERFHALQNVLSGSHPKLMAISAGCCTRCKECTCPHEPCRFPEKMVSSMEAYGMLVLEVCKSNGMKYYYGPDKIAYTSCFLLE